VKASVLLENGRVFEGEWRGYRDGAFVGEVVFNTSMTGYQEILTDPSYAGQMVTMTYPEIGNYGVNLADVESKKIHCRGLIVREISEITSNFTSTQSLEDYLIAHKVACLSEVDTRALTRELRDQGAMRGTFLAEGESPAVGMLRIKAFHYEGIDHAAAVTGDQDGADYLRKANRPLVAVLDFGIKSNILRLLSEFANCEVFSVQNFPLKRMSEFSGFFLSNGPGDPQAVEGAMELIKSFLATKKPLFGICLGHQLLSLALGGKTYKLKFGHHGANHPVKNLLTGCVEISSQNHGFAVDPQSFPKNVAVESTHLNLNDGSLAGLQLKDAPVYSIQYHPEAAPGPRDASYLFGKFKKDLGV
jgi:carbamoyl-phosphate synthase small subunit